MVRYAVDPLTFLRLAREERAHHDSHQLVAPNSLRALALELLLGEVISDALGDREAMALHERLTEIRVRLLGDRVTRRVAWQIARERGWTTLRDAEFFAVTRVQADAFVTIDPRMAELADGVVPTAPYEALFTAQ